MKKILTLALLAAATTFGANITTYTTLIGFTGSAIVAAGGAGPTVTESFNTNSSLFTTFEIPGGPGLLPGFSGGPFDGERNSRVTTSYSEVITLNGGNMTAFGGLWDLSPISLLGSGLRLTITLVGGGTQQVVPILGYNVGNGDNEFFFGFTSDVAFSAVTISQAGQNGLSSEGFDLDELMIEQAGAVEPPPPPPSGIPEPSTFGLMGLAMVGLGMARRFRK